MLPSRGVSCPTAPQPRPRAGPTRAPTALLRPRWLLVAASSPGSGAGPQASKCRTVHREDAAPSQKAVCAFGGGSAHGRAPCWPQRLVLSLGAGALLPVASPLWSSPTPGQWVPRAVPAAWDPSAVPSPTPSPPERQIPLPPTPRWHPVAVPVLTSAHLLPMGPGHVTAHCPRSCAGAGPEQLRLAACRSPPPQRGSARSRRAEGCTGRESRGAAPATHSQGGTSVLMW